MQKKTKIASLVAAITLVTGGLAIGSPTATGGSIFACLSASAGTLTKVSTKAPKCPRGTTLITWNQVGPRGLQGVAGPSGPAGQVGPIGQPGPNGLNGLNGLDGRQGLQGPIGLIGPAGPQGLQGENGLQGDVGPIGLIGPIGPEGPRGLQGENGLQGDLGPKGDQGDKGRDGNSGFGVYAVSQGEMYPVYFAHSDSIVKIQGTWWQIGGNFGATGTRPNTWRISASIGMDGGYEGLRKLVPEALAYTNPNCSGDPLGYLFEQRWVEGQSWLQPRDNSWSGTNHFDESAIKLFSTYYRASHVNVTLSAIESHQTTRGYCISGQPETSEYFSLYDLVEIEKPTITFNPALKAG